MSEAKTKPTAVAVADFIAAAPENRQEDARALAALFTAIVGEPATMWGPSIIGFGRYHYRYDSGRTGEAPLLGFSPRKANLVVYMMTGYADAAEQLALLGKHKTGQSCLYLNRLADVDLSVLEAMARRSVAEMRARWPEG